MSVYNASRELVQKVSDEILSEAVTIDTLLGSPSVAYAGRISENSSDHLVVASHLLGIGIISFLLSYSFQKDNSKRIGFGAIGVFSALAGIIYYLYR